MSRWEDTKNEHSILEAIQLHTEALDHCASGDPNRGYFLANLGSELLSLFEINKDFTLVNKAEKLLKQALEARPLGHPNRFSTHFSLARRYLKDPSREDLYTALIYTKTAIEDVYAAARRRLAEAIPILIDIDAITRSKPQIFDSALQQSILDCFSSAINLLTRVAHFGLDYSSRLRELAGSDQLGRIAGSRAIISSQPHLGIELMEAGRGVFWAQALHLRSSEIDHLPSTDRLELQRMFTILDGSGINTSLKLLKSGREKMEAQRLLAERRRLSDRAEKLIEGIRSRPGLQRFMMAKPFSELARAASHGAVVILCSTPSVCHAVVIFDSSGRTEVVPLVPLSSRDVADMALKISQNRIYPRAQESSQQNLTPRAIGISKAPKSRVSATPFKSSFEEGLAEMWSKIVRPVLDALCFRVSKHLISNISLSLSLSL
jgi:hypothetical protein